MKIEVYDQHLFKLACTNPLMIVSVMLDWAGVWARGKPEIDELIGDGLHKHPFAAFEFVVDAAGKQLNPGGSLIPTFLRALADGIEREHVRHVEEEFRIRPNMIAGMPELFQQWAKSGFPRPPIEMTYDKDMTEQWRKLVHGEADSAPFLES